MQRIAGALRIDPPVLIPFQPAMPGKIGVRQIIEMRFIRDLLSTRLLRKPLTAFQGQVQRSRPAAAKLPANQLPIQVGPPTHEYMQVGRLGRDAVALKRLVGECLQCGFDHDSLC